jgi:hypothetical protein
MRIFNTIEFKIGFEFRGIKYAFHKKQLYRLPFQSGFRYYGLKVIQQISVGNLPGYRCAREKLSINKIKGLLKQVDWKVEEPTRECLPF